MIPLLMVGKIRRMYFRDGMSVREIVRRSIDLAPAGAAIRACSNGDGRFIHAPSLLFPDHAAFDTKHLGVPEKAPAHGTLRIAHAFVEFPYATFPNKSRKKRADRLIKIEDELDL